MAQIVFFALMAAPAAALGWMLFSIVANQRRILSRMESDARQRSALLEAVSSPAKRHAARCADGPLRVRLIASRVDLEEFALALAKEFASKAPEGAAENLRVTFGPELSTVLHPLHVVAIPDGDAHFDIQALAMDPLSDLADLEAKVMALAASSARADPSIPQSRRL